MEDPSTSEEAQPEEEAADNLQEGSSDSSDDEEAASSADDSPESTIEPGVVKAMRRLAKQRTSLTPLAVLASALVLALVVRRQMHPVEEELVEAAEKPKVKPIGPPEVGGVLEKTPGKLMEPPPRFPGVSQEELVEGGDKPKLELIGPPEKAGVLEKTPGKLMEPPRAESSGVSQEELVEGGDKPKLELIGPPEVDGVLEKTPGKPMPVQAPVPVQTKARFHEYEKFEVRLWVKGIKNCDAAASPLGLPLFGALKVQKLVNDVVQWAKEAPVEKDKSLDDNDLWDSLLAAVWRTDGVRYKLAAHFTKLTPAYDAERVSLSGLIVTMNFESALFKQTAAELAKGVPQLLEETHLYEKQAREGKKVRLLILDFGDPQSGKGMVSIHSELFRSLRLVDAPPVA
ncbi:hypothetical protein Emed_006413 [Eimeria media]